MPNFAGGGTSRTQAPYLVKTLKLELKALPGERVKIPELEQKAIIRCVTVNQGGTVQYEVHYFANGDRKSCYLYADEFESVA